MTIYEVFYFERYDDHAEIIPVKYFDVESKALNFISLNSDQDYHYQKVEVE